MFWIFFIVGWILVHAITRGTYRFKGLEPTDGNRKVFGSLIGVVAVLYLIMSAAGLGDEALMGWLAAFGWLFILCYNSSREAKGSTYREHFEETEKLRRRIAKVQKVDEATAQQPTAHEIDRGWDTRKKVAQRRQEHLQERFNETAAGRQKQISGEYRSEQDEVMQITGDVLGLNSRQKASISGPSGQAPTYVNYQTPVAADEQPPEPQIAQPQVSPPAAPPEVQPETVPAQAQPEPLAGQAAAPDAEAAPYSGWQAPAIEHERYKLDNAGEKPQSIFGSGGGPARLGNNAGSLFGNSEVRPLTASAGSEVDKLLAENRLVDNTELTRPQAVLGGTGTAGAVETAAPAIPAEVDKVLEQHRLGQMDEELTKPHAVLEQSLDDEPDDSFHYKPTSGIKSRF